MQVFLTGATGFIGNRVAAILRDRGDDVTCLVRDLGRAEGLVGMGCRLVEGDITDPPSLDAMAGHDAVIHLAAWYKVGARDRSMAERINVDGTRNVLEAMQRHRIPKGVYVSTLAVHSDTGGRLVDESHRHEGPFLSEYDRTKWLAHHEVAAPMMQGGLPLVIVQPGVVYGPGDRSAMGRTLRDYLRGRLPAVPRGVAYCWGHVDDTAAGIVAALGKGHVGEAYHIAGPPHTLEGALHIAEAVSGVKAPTRTMAPGALRLMSVLMRPWARVVPETYHPETLRVAAGNTYLGDSTKAASELGWTPRPLEEGLQETLAFEKRALGLD